ncbi:MAG: ABC transporter substrate binding protein [Anaerolineaceae bacterium]|nr:MAG: ABC transporter substrate binding protein [Anaerolineaceae bacterium]
MNRSGRKRLALLVVAGLFLFTACGGGPPAQTGDSLNVLATTSIVADVVAQVGGDFVTLTVLLPAGTDPHAFSPQPQDAAALADADIIFANGAGLEAFLPPLLESAGADGKLVEVSAGIELQPLPGGDASTGDPHTWMDPNNVIVWTQNIAAALSSADPAHAADYQANAAAYAASLRALDAWIRAQVEQVPPANRLLVSDHAVLGYFAARYGFTQAGSITGSFSSEAAPSAQELAALEDKIRADGVRAIFVTEASNQSLADQVARDTGIQAVWLYHASLTEAGGPVPTYLDFMRYNVNAIVNALK